MAFFDSSKKWQPNQAKIISKIPYLLCEMLNLWIYWWGLDCDQPDWEGYLDEVYLCQWFKSTRTSLLKLDHMDQEFDSRSVLNMHQTRYSYCYVWNLNKCWNKTVIHLWWYMWYMMTDLKEERKNQDQLECDGKLLVVLFRLTNRFMVVINSVLDFWKSFGP